MVSQTNTAHACRKSPDEGNGSIIEELYGKQEKKVSPKKEEQNTPVGPVYDDEM